MNGRGRDRDRDHAWSGFARAQGDTHRPHERSRTPHASSDPRGSVPTGPGATGSVYDNRHNDSGMRRNRTWDRRGSTSDDARRNSEDARDEPARQDAGVARARGRTPFGRAAMASALDGDGDSRMTGTHAPPSASHLKRTKSLSGLTAAARQDLQRLDTQVGDTTLSPADPQSAGPSPRKVPSGVISSMGPTRARRPDAIAPARDLRLTSRAATAPLSLPTTPAMAKHPFIPSPASDGPPPNGSAVQGLVQRFAAAAVLQVKYDAARSRLRQRNEESFRWRERVPDAGAAVEHDRRELARYEALALKLQKERDDGHAAAGALFQEYVSALEPPPPSEVDKATVGDVVELKRNIVWLKEQVQEQGRQLAQVKAKAITTSLSAHDVDVLRGDISGLREDVATTEEVVQLRRKVEELQRKAETDASRTDIASRKEIDDLRTSLQSSERRVANLDARAETNLECLEGEIRALKTQNDDLKAKLAELQGLTKLPAAVTGMGEKVDKVNNAVDALQKSCDMIPGAIEDVEVVKSEHQAFKEYFKEKESKWQQEKEEEQSRMQVEANLEQKTNDLTERVRVLEVRDEDKQTIITKAQDLHSKVTKKLQDDVSRHEGDLVRHGTLLMKTVQLAAIAPLKEQVAQHDADLTKLNSQDAAVQARELVAIKERLVKHDSILYGNATEEDTFPGIQNRVDGVQTMALALVGRMDNMTLEPYVSSIIHQLRSMYPVGVDHEARLGTLETHMRNVFQNVPLIHTRVEVLERLAHRSTGPASPQATAGSPNGPQSPALPMANGHTNGIVAKTKDAPGNFAEHAALLGRIRDSAAKADAVQASLQKLKTRVEGLATQVGQCAGKTDVQEEMLTSALAGLETVRQELKALKDRQAQQSQAHGRTFGEQSSELGKQRDEVEERGRQHEELCAKIEEQEKLCKDAQQSCRAAQDQLAKHESQLAEISTSQEVYNELVDDATKGLKALTEKHDAFQISVDNEWGKHSSKLEMLENFYRQQERKARLAESHSEHTASNPATPSGPAAPAIMDARAASTARTNSSSATNPALHAFSTAAAAAGSATPAGSSRASSSAVSSADPLASSDAGRSTLLRDWQRLRAQTSAQKRGSASVASREPAARPALQPSPQWQQQQAVNLGGNMLRPKKRRRGQVADDDEDGDGSGDFVP